MSVPVPIQQDLYKYALKHQVVEGLKLAFINSPYPQFKDIYIGLEYPLEQASYPAIYITYSEGPIRNVGLGNLDIEDSIPTKVRHYWFHGGLNFNVMALDPVDRDILSSLLVQILSMGREMRIYKPVFDFIENMDFITLTMNSETITPNGENVADVPWENSDELLYQSGYQVQMIGNFFTNAETGDLIEIEQVNVNPYREGQPPVF